MSGWRKTAHEKIYIKRKEKGKKKELSGWRIWNEKNRQRTEGWSYNAGVDFKMKITHSGWEMSSEMKQRERRKKLKFVKDS